MNLSFGNYRIKTIEKIVPGMLIAWVGHNNPPDFLGIVCYADSPDTHFVLWYTDKYPPDTQSDWWIREYCREVVL